MSGWLRKIVRFSNAMRIVSIVTIIALCIAYLTPHVHPNHLWILPFFGLAYPLLVVFALLIVIYWFFFRSYKWALVLLFFIGIGYPYVMNLYAFGKEEINQEKVQTSIRVFSNNVQIFDLYEENKEQKYTTRDSIFSYALSQQPDVVCFQEFYSKDNPTPFQTEQLFYQEFGAVDFHKRFIYKKVGRQHFGVIMYSRLPIIAKGEVIYSSDDETNYNFCIYIDIVKNQDTFRIYNAHLQSFRISKIEEEENSKKSMIKGIISKLRTAYPKRADQAERIVEHIKNSPYPVIVCGDFNDTSVSFVYNQFNSILTDAFLTTGEGIGATYVGKLPAGRIDYIFHSNGLTAENFTIQEHPYSDHRAIACTIHKMKNNE